VATTPPASHPRRPLPRDDDRGEDVQPAGTRNRIDLDRQQQRQQREVAHDPAGIGEREDQQERGRATVAARRWIAENGRARHAATLSCGGPDRQLLRGWFGWAHGLS